MTRAKSIVKQSIVKPDPLLLLLNTTRVAMPAVPRANGPRTGRIETQPQE
jgi:hypothetical protein